MSDKTGQKPTNKKRHPKPLKQEFSKRPDGRYNFWQLMSYVEGHSINKHVGPFWVIRGVFNRLPKWA